MNRFSGGRLGAAAFVTLFSTSAFCQKYDSLTLAQNLGYLLASETYCGFSYDQNAISKFIEQNVDASDLEFSAQLRLYTRTTKPDLETMTESQKTAHCTQSKRLAASFGFLKK
jgi:hypothetical protein